MRKVAIGSFSAYRFRMLGVGKQSDHGFNGDTVICLHGFPDTIHSFRHQVPALTKAGDQVIVPVMRGYEPSSVQPDKQYFLNQLAQDIVDWMDWLELPKAHIVGHDWGAATAWIMTALAPDRVKSLTSIAIPPIARLQQAVPAVPSQLAYSWYMGFFQLTGFSDWMVEAQDWQFIRYLWNKWSPDFENNDAYVAEVIEALSAPGVKRAALRYYRCLALVRNPHWKESQRLLKALVSGDKITVPVQIIYGVNDGCMSEEIFNVAIKPGDYKAGIVVHPVEGAGHFVQLEKPVVVSRLLTEFLSG